MRLAKEANPGNLHLPEQELILVEREDAHARTVLGAAITSSGIIPLPRDGNLEEFRSALQTVYGDKAMLLTIDVETLKKIDAGAIPITGEQLTKPSGEPSFWSDERQYADETELIPVSLITLSRPPPADEIKS